MDPEVVRLVGYALVALPAMYLAVRPATHVGGRDYLSATVGGRTLRFRKWWVVFAWILAAGSVVYWRETGDAIAAAGLALFLATVTTLALRNFASHQLRMRAAFDSVANAQRSGDPTELAAARRQLLRQGLMSQPALAAVFLAVVGGVLFDAGEPLLGYAFAAAAFTLLIAVVVRLLRRQLAGRAG